MEIVMATKNVTKSDIFNVISASKAMKDTIGVVIEAKAAVVMKGVDNDTGEVKCYNYILSDDGTAYGGNSSVVGKMMPLLVDIIDEDGNVKIMFEKITSKSGRDGVTLRII